MLHQILRVRAYGFLLAAASQPLSAQVPSVGDLDMDGRVYAKVVVTIAGGAGSFGQPASGLRFLVVSESGDRISARTDDAGIASLGYGISRNFALFLTIDAAKIDISDPDITAPTLSRRLTLECG